MIVQYNMGNFKTGKAKVTESKEAMQTFVSMGYKLISIAYLSNADYLRKFK